MKIAGVILAILFACVTDSGTQAAPPGVFRLEVPEFKLQVNENGTATIAHSFVSQLQLQVLRSSQEIPPGKVLVRINGVSANTIMSSRTAESSILCDLDLYLRPGYLLHAGRNSIEAAAESIYGRPYYATFLLDVEGEPESLREIQHSVTVNKPGAQPPFIHLLQPQGVIQYQKQVLLQGYVEGGAGEPVLSVQGAEARLVGHPASPSTRGVQLAGGTQYSFDVAVKLANGQESIELTATDAHNNRDTVTIPVIQRKQAPKTRYAVVIGVSRYRNSRIRSLEFADRDAESVRDFLIDPNGGGVPAGNVLFLTNENATFAQIHSALFDFLAKPGPDDLVIVYFAGHGTNDINKRPDNYYLVAYDTDPNNLGGTAVAMWDLQIAFERTLQADAVSLIDACHSGGIGETRPNMTNERWRALGYGKHRAIITASQTSEFSREGAEWGGGHGVFTYFLLQGLRNGAAANHDRQLSVGELFAFVRAHVVEATGGAQTPSALAGIAGGLVITRSLSQASARVDTGKNSNSGGAL